MLYGSCIKGCCVSEQEVAATKTILCLFALREDPFSERRSLPRRSFDSLPHHGDGRDDSGIGGDDHLLLTWFLQ